MASPEIISLPAAAADIWASWDMRFNEPVFASRTEARLTERASIGDEGFWTLQALSHRFSNGDDYALMDAMELFAQRCQVNSVFAADDKFRPRTRSVSSALTDGQGVIATIVSSREITVTGLQANLILTEGSLVELRKPLLADAHKRCLLRLREQATVDGAGAVTLRLAHPLAEAVFSVADLVIVERPTTLMRVIDYQLPKPFGQRQFTMTAEEVMFS